MNQINNNNGVNNAGNIGGAQSANATEAVKVGLGKITAVAPVTHAGLTPSSSYAQAIMQTA